MRLVNVRGRLGLAHGDAALDVASASEGRFGPDPQEIYDRWDEFVAWASALAAAGQGTVEPAPFSPADLGPPVPAPRQVFAIGLNYQEHAAESGIAVPTGIPPVFTKFRSAITGPDGDIALPDGTVDWEVELVVVIGRRAERVPPERAWDHVAGVTVGQDLSERQRQFEGPVPQFSLGKSFPGFAPIGPAVVTVDELADPDDLALGCVLDGERVQQARTSELLVPVPALVARLSSVIPLLPGDLIFTGTPPGVGMARRPPRFLAPGDTLVSYVEGVGEMRHRFIAGP
jgi:2,4-didehydro-3-deoxy-L-rhamnonate hydrolase